MPCQRLAQHLRALSLRKTHNDVWSSADEAPLLLSASAEKNSRGIVQHSTLLALQQTQRLCNDSVLAIWKTNVGDTSMWRLERRAANLAGTDGVERLQRRSDG